MRANRFFFLRTIPLVFLVALVPSQKICATQGMHPILRKSWEIHFPSFYKQSRLWLEKLLCGRFGEDLLPMYFSWLLQFNPIR